MDEPGGRMESEAHLICEEDFRLENFDDNKEIPAMAEFRSGDLKWMIVHRIVIEWNKELNDVRFWDKRPMPEQRIETPWPDGGFGNRRDAVDLDGYINALPDPQTLLPETKERLAV